MYWHTAYTQIVNKGKNFENEIENRKCLESKKLKIPTSRMFYKF